MEEDLFTIIVVILISVASVTIGVRNLFWTYTTVCNLALPREFCSQRLHEKN